eukprot:gene9619-11788_t
MSTVDNNNINIPLNNASSNVPTATTATSSSNGKRLCESKKKVCSKRPMELYRYCIKHILEDPTAPFSQCEFISTRSNKQCTNPVSIKDMIPQYCVSHKHAVDLVDQQQKKKRHLETTTEDNGITSKKVHLDTDDSQQIHSKKILKVLAKHGISKGKNYLEYKKLKQQQQSSNNLKDKNQQVKEFIRYKERLRILRRHYLLNHNLDHDDDQPDENNNNTESLSTTTSTNTTTTTTTTNLNTNNIQQKQQEQGHHHDGNQTK